jgi:hypothetical protein
VRHGCILWRRRAYSPGQVTVTDPSLAVVHCPLPHALAAHGHAGAPLQEGGGEAQVSPASPLVAAAWFRQICIVTSQVLEPQ